MAKKKCWYRRRGYLHFDQPVGYQTARAVVRLPRNVATHSFFPLIKYCVSTKKISKDINGITVKEKQRPLAYAAHMDSHIYSYYAQKLSNAYEDKLKQHSLGDCVLAFRPLGYSNIDFAAMAFEEIRRQSSCCAVALDVTGFFDNLDHRVIKDSWSSVLDTSQLPYDHYAVYKSLTKYSVVEKDALDGMLSLSLNGSKNSKQRICSAKEFREIVRGGGLVLPNEKSFGIPQGTPMSAIVSNIYMLKFDIAAEEMMRVMGGKYFRYCDDMLFIAPVEFKDIVAGEIRKKIKNIKLDINTDKTEIRVFLQQGGVLKSDKPLQYLGFLFDGERVLIRSASLARYSQRMKRGVKLAKRTMIKRNRIRALKGHSDKPLFKRKIYTRYSHLGKRNFIRYGLRAADILDSKEIREQIKPLWGRLVAEIET